MPKTLIGPRLRQLRRERKQTQAEMAAILGISTSYVNLLENNQRSLSVQMLMAISDAYAIDWRDLTVDLASHKLAELRAALHDPMLSGERPDLQEMRAAVDHAPGLVEKFLQLHSDHRLAVEKIMKLAGTKEPEAILQSTPEAIVHDFFRNNFNYFSDIEVAAEGARQDWPMAPDDHYAALKSRLLTAHRITVELRPIDDMSDALRYYDRETSKVLLSQALDHPNRVFQLVHVLCLLEHESLLLGLIEKSGIKSAQALARLKVELANYFAAAFLMPYQQFWAEAELVAYDLDRLAARFGTSFEQVCQRLTTMQREGARGVPFFFLRIDKAGNVIKRFNATSFNLAEYGGSCPVWNIHTAFYQPGVITPQFVEMPDGARFFTLSRTVHRPVFSRQTQDRRLTLALGCEFKFARRIGYADRYNVDEPGLFSPIGINCQLCPRQACSQRAHQPLLFDLPIDTDRRGSTRYES